MRIRSPLASQLFKKKKKKAAQTPALLCYLSTSQWLNAGLRAVEFCFE